METLYERDLYAWAMRNVVLLRGGSRSEFTAAIVEIYNQYLF